MQSIGRKQKYAWQNWLQDWLPRFSSLVFLFYVNSQGVYTEHYCSKILWICTQYYTIFILFLQCCQLSLFSYELCDIWCLLTLTFFNPVFTQASQLSFYIHCLCVCEEKRQSRYTQKTLIFERNMTFFFFLKPILFKAVRMVFFNPVSSFSKGCLKRDLV